jgi:hypothetical protein
LSNDSFWTRLAAASGIGFVGAAVAAYVLTSTKHFANAGEVATKASNNLWGTWVLLVALAGVALLWFTSTSAARLREIEGGSRRISSEHMAAGTVVAALLFVEVAIQFAVRTAPQAGGLIALATSLVNGPVLTFAAGVYVLAAGVVGTRAGAALPVMSGVIARLSVLLGVALIAAGGLWLFRDYAWLNDSAFFAFVGWVFVRSALGTFRWADLDMGDFAAVTVATAARRPVPARVSPSTAPNDDLEDTFVVPSLVRKARSERKSSSRRSTTRPASKPAARKKAPATRTPPKPAAPKPAPKPAAPKPAARKPAKRAPRKAAPPRARPEPEPEPASAPAEEESQTDALESLLDFDEPES